MVGVVVVACMVFAGEGRQEKTDQGLTGLPGLSPYNATPMLCARARVWLCVCVFGFLVPCAECSVHDIHAGGGWGFEVNFIHEGWMVGSCGRGEGRGREGKSRSGQVGASRFVAAFTFPRYDSSDLLIVPV